MWRGPFATGATLNRGKNSVRQQAKQLQRFWEASPAHPSGTSNASSAATSLQAADSAASSADVPARIDGRAVRRLGSRCGSVEGELSLRGGDLASCGPSAAPNAADLAVPIASRSSHAVAALLSTCHLQPSPASFYPSHSGCRVLRSRGFRSYCSTSPLASSRQRRHRDGISSNQPGRSDRWKTQNPSVAPSVSAIPVQPSTSSIHAAPASQIPLVFRQHVHTAPVPSVASPSPMPSSSPSATSSAAPPALLDRDAIAHHLFPSDRSRRLANSSAVVAAAGALRSNRGSFAPGNAAADAAPAAVLATNMALPCRQLLAAVSPASVFHVIDTWACPPDVGAAVFAGPHAASVNAAVNAVNAASGAGRDASANPWSLALVRGGAFPPAGGSGGREDVLHRLGGAVGGSAVGQIGEGSGRGRGISGTAAFAGAPEPVSEVSGAEAEGAGAGAGAGEALAVEEAGAAIEAKSLAQQSIAEDTEPLWTLDLDPIRRGSFRLGQRQRAQLQSSSGDSSSSDSGSGFKESLTEGARVYGDSFSSTDWDRLVVERFVGPQRAESGSRTGVLGSGVGAKEGEAGGEGVEGARQQQQQRQRRRHSPFNELQQAQRGQAAHEADLTAVAAVSGSAGNAAGAAAAAPSGSALEALDGGGGGQDPAAEEALWRVRVAELMRLASEEVEQRHNKLKVRAEDEERQRQREVEAYKHAAEEFRREQQEMMQKRMGPRTGMGQHLMGQWFGRLKDAILQEKARYESNGATAAATSGGGGGGGGGSMGSADRALQVFGEFLVKVDAEKLAAMTLNRTVDLLLAEQARGARAREGAQGGQRQVSSFKGETSKGYRSFTKTVSLATQIGKAVEVEMNLARVQEEVLRGAAALRLHAQKIWEQEQQAKAGVTEGVEVGGAGSASEKGKGKERKKGKGRGSAKADAAVEAAATESAAEAGGKAVAEAAAKAIEQRMEAQKRALRKLKKGNQMTEWQKSRLVAAAVAQAQEPWSTQHCVQVGSCLIQLLLQSAHVPHSLLHKGGKKGEEKREEERGAVEGKEGSVVAEEAGLEGKEGSVVAEEAGLEGKEGSVEGQEGAEGGVENDDEFVPAFVMDRVNVGIGGAHQRYGVIACAKELKDILDNYALQRAPFMPYMPMLVPPREWQRYNWGGYLFLPSAIMRVFGNPEQRNVLHHTDPQRLSRVFQALNVLGSTAWRINRKVLSVLEEIWEQGGGKAGLVDRNDVLVPEEPPEGANEEERKAFKRARRKALKENMERHSMRQDLRLKLEVARQYVDEPRFYYPHNLDFRGRAYPMHPHLNHLGADHCRGLLHFANGKPLGPSGLRWLKIHLANLVGSGADKLSFDDRVKFVDERMAEVRASAERPLEEGGGWWMDAEDPFQCLAACVEITAAVDSGCPEKFVSHLPVHQDGSCNGLQHYAALGRDVEGARSVNMVSNEKPADVYTGIADLVKEVVRRDVAAHYGPTPSQSSSQDQNEGGSESESASGRVAAGGVETAACSSGVREDGEEGVEAGDSLRGDADGVSAADVAALDAILGDGSSSSSSGSLCLGDGEEAWSSDNDPAATLLSPGDSEDGDNASTDSNDWSNGRTRDTAHTNSSSSSSSSSRTGSGGGDGESKPERRRLTPEESRDLLLWTAEASRKAVLARFLTGQVDRKLVKQTVMTSVYGVTFVGARTQIMNRIKERELTDDDRQLYSASAYAARVTLSAMDQMFDSARQIMAWLGTCAQLIAAENESVSWTTPLGLPVVQPYRKEGRRVVKTALQSFTLIDERKSRDVVSQRQKSAFPPNFVHSLDSTHMMMTAMACHNRRITFAGVHDSYWTHASSVDRMNVVLRKQFVALHGQPLLENLLEEFREKYPHLDFPNVPRRGEFDLKNVLSAPYFFD